MSRLLTVLILFLGVLTMPLQATPNSLISSAPKTFCNPLNLNYLIQPSDPCRREAADPVCLVFQGKYYLFASKSEGYWVSTDFVNWNVVSPRILPLDNYAPAVFEYKGALYFMASGAGKLYRSTDPENADSWSLVGTVPSDTDPDLFLDDDGRVYLYYGSHPGGPIAGVELDPAHQFQTIGHPTDLIHQDAEERGWERGGGESHAGTRAYLEGAWMTKHIGKYYLQYAAPGTQWKTYADGAYLGDKPLGPFTYAPYSPISYKPTGFMGGAGHSATFADLAGNLWRITTGVISVNHIFERRLALYPQGFDSEGRMFTRTYLGDLPQFLPGVKKHPEVDNSPGWMLLSYHKAVSASSSLAHHPASAAADDDIRTWWSAEAKGPGQWLEMDLGSLENVAAVQVNFAEQDVVTRGRVPGFAQKYTLEYSVDGQSWLTLVDKSTNSQDVPHDYLELNAPLKLRYLKITDVSTPGEGRFAIRDLRVFGNASVNASAPVKGISVTRSAQSRRAAVVSWPESPGAEGYIVRYGVASNALWNQYEIRGTHQLSLTCLNATPSYWFAIDSFNEKGVTEYKGEPVAAP